MPRAAVFARSETRPERIPCAVPGCCHTRARGDLPPEHNQILCRTHWAYVDEDRKRDHRKAGMKDPVRWAACVLQACERVATGAGPAPRNPNKKRSKRGVHPETWSGGAR